MVADDDPAVVWFMSGLLRAAGAEVLEAHDGRTALELTRDGWPDAVISDVLMPGLDGFSLCHELKRDVAVRDIPVILLSWKEDLLQRVRELGADAAAYLRKEATASQVARRVREVLGPRARVEARMAAGGEVRGRLDGLTPRLVLQLACRTGRDLRVSVRDAAYLYEVEVRGGRLRCATRTASDGSFERGDAAIGALLGASAGRFVVTAASDTARQEFEGTLEQVLARPIGRARAVQELLDAEGLLDVERVEIDAAGMASYLESTPEPARGLVQRIIDGASPRAMLLAGEASARLLEDVLSDVARHGAVRRVVQSDGHETDTATAPPAPVGGPHIEAARRAEPTPPPPHLVQVPVAEDADAPAQLFSFQLSPVPPDVGPDSGPALPRVMVPDSVDNGWERVAPAAPPPRSWAKPSARPRRDLPRPPQPQKSTQRSRGSPPIRTLRRQWSRRGRQRRSEGDARGASTRRIRAGRDDESRSVGARPRPDEPIVVRKIVMPPRPRAEALLHDGRRASVRRRVPGRHRSRPGTGIRRAGPSNRKPPRRSRSSRKPPKRSRSSRKPPRLKPPTQSRTKPDDAKPEAEPPLPPAKKIEFPPRAGRTEVRHARPEPEPEPGLEPEPEPEPDSEMTPGPSAELKPASAERPMGALRMALIAAAAGIVSFGAVRLITAPGPAKHGRQRARGESHGFTGGRGAGQGFGQRAGRQTEGRAHRDGRRRAGHGAAARRADRQGQGPARGRHRRPSGHLCRRSLRGTRTAPAHPARPR